MSQLTVFNNYPGIQIFQSSVEAIRDIVAVGEKISFADVRLIIGNDKELNQFKRRYFDEDLLTDTISFNLNDSGQPIEGEIYISIDRIRANAKKYKTGFARELTLVLLHSFLHLVGYDDETAEEKEMMNRKQRQYSKQLPPLELFRFLEKE
jgi:probable rRNA maturation factor